VISSLATKPGPEKTVLSAYPQRTSGLASLVGRDQNLAFRPGSQESIAPAFVSHGADKRRAHDLNKMVPLQDELALGRRKLIAIFNSSPPRLVTTGELLAGADSNNSIYHLRSGWACQIHDFANGRRAILDIYLPGDVIGFDAAVRSQPLEEILTLTAATVDAIPGEDALIELMADPPTALYITYLLGKRQQRIDRLLAAISCLDARGRLAIMLLDFYKRLRRRKLISAPTYNLPLTQVQIGNYLGLTVVHINRVLRSLRVEQIVNVEKHSVMILNLERLALLAQKRAGAR
jgi:CRP/FNR family transcriptional regulator, anaerobic regulatory protein